MYCKHCGKEIADDSKFCQHCGGKQDTVSDSTQSDESVIDNESSKGKVIEIPTIKANFSDKTKWLIFGYGLWLVLNLYWLFAGDKSSNAANCFQPFSEELFSSMSYYDISEFIVYVIGVPLAIWGILLYRKKYKGKDSALTKFIKSYGFYLIIILITIIIAILTIALSTSKDESDYTNNYYENLNNRTQQSVPTQENYNIDSKELEKRFDSHLDEVNKQMMDITNEQIKNLPSEIDKKYP